MTNLLEQAINCNDGDHAAKIIQDALGIETRRRRQLRLSQDLADRPRAACSHHRRVVADRGALSSLMPAAASRRPGPSIRYWLIY